MWGLPPPCECDGGDELGGGGRAGRLDRIEPVSDWFVPCGEGPSYFRFLLLSAVGDIRLGCFSTLFYFQMLVTEEVTINLMLMM